MATKSEAPGKIYTPGRIWSNWVTLIVLAALLLFGGMRAGGDKALFMQVTSIALFILCLGVASIATAALSYHTLRFASKIP